MKDPLSIHLDHENAPVVLRSLGDDESVPATLSGSVVLDLHERTDLKDIRLEFTGRAHITYTDIGGSYKTHNLDVPVFFHDQSFFPDFDATGHGSTSRSGPVSFLHSHTNPSSQPSSRRSSFTLDGPALGEHPLTVDTSNTPAHLRGDEPHSPTVGVTRRSTEDSQKSHIQTQRPKQHHHHSHHHAHTLRAGLHRFPFSITVPGSLPASLRVGSGSSILSYQLKVTAIKSGMFGHKYTAKRSIQVVRGLSPESGEYIQTLEIENTWPGKIMYSLTLPHKAFCAGDRMPIALKFTPIGKGVKVTQLVTVIREHVTVLDKNGQPHTTQRDICTKKHNFYSRNALANAATNDQAGGAHPVSLPPSRNASHADLPSLVGQASRLQAEETHSAPASGSASRGRTGLSTPDHLAYPTPSMLAHGITVADVTNALNGLGVNGGMSAGIGSGPSSNSGSRPNSRAASPERVYYGRNAADPDFAGFVNEDDGLEDADVDAVISVHVPSSATPTHTIDPILVSHKIRWSAYIRNLDGHVSELRCALPIHILSQHLREEAKLATTGTRSLLFGPSGALIPAQEGIQQADLPSYQEHVRDRIANIDSLDGVSASNSTAVSGGAAPASFARSPWASPPISQSHSPEAGNSLTNAAAGPTHGYFPQDRGINWADSELLGSLSLTQQQQVQLQQSRSHHSSHDNSADHSPSVSRPGSRPSSRPNSRPASRASSPVRGDPSDSAYGINQRQTSSGNLQLLDEPHRSGSASALFKSYKTPQSGHDDRPHFAATLSHLLHHGKSTSPRGAHYHDGRESASVTPQHSPPMSRTASSNAVHATASSSSDIAAQTIAALEAQQAKARKGKGKATFGFGKKRAAFTTVHNDDDEHAHDHDHEHLAADGSGDHSHENETQVDPSGAKYLSQVPSYDVARRGFLGGGVVPLSLSVGLPDYDTSESQSRPTTPRL